MKLIQLILILAFVIVGCVNRRQLKNKPDAARTGTAQTAVNKEILQNAEHLAETLRQCQQTAHKNKETK